MKMANAPFFALLFGVSTTERVNLGSVATEDDHRSSWTAGSPGWRLWACVLKGRGEG